MKTLVFLACFLLSFPAEACLLEDLQTQTFFKVAPKNALDMDEVAKVRLENTWIEHNTGHRISLVRVIESYKGTKAPNLIRVISDGSDCALDRITLHKLYYIAGKLDKTGTFYGEWYAFGGFNYFKPLMISR